MRRPPVPLLILFSCTTVVLAAALAWALFVNGGFEDTTFTGWSQSPFLNLGLLGTPPFDAEDIQRGGGGFWQSVIECAPTETGVDAQLGAGASLRFPKFGSCCARVNGPMTMKFSNSILQTLTVATSDVDPNDGKVHVHFAFAPVLQDAGHEPNDQPYFFVHLRNLTKGSSLYHRFVFAGESGVPWKPSPLDPTVFYTDWQTVDIAAAPTEVAVGDELELEVIGASCALGAHYGYVYVDGFGFRSAGLVVRKTAGVDQVEAGRYLTWTFHYENPGPASADDVLVVETIPDCASYVSSTDPSTGGIISYDAQAGELRCDLGSLAPGTRGSFTVTVQASFDQASCPSIHNGNYWIESSTVLPTLGMPVTTPIVEPVPPTPAHLAVDARFSQIHQVEPPIFHGSEIDLLDEHWATNFGGAWPELGGEFQSQPGDAGSCHWQGWTSVDRSIEIDYAHPVGDFAGLWKDLEEVDPCEENLSCQVAFIDQGGWNDPTWDYGPDGWDINPSGGLSGAGYYLWNEVWSPELDIPEDHNAARLAFDVYLHQELHPDWARIFAVWHVRSYDPDEGAWTEWRDHDRQLYGGPAYIHFEEIVTDLLAPGCSKLQIALGVKQEAPVNGEGLECNSGPYFDNVELISYETSGTTITTMEHHLALDAFLGQPVVPPNASDVHFLRAHPEPDDPNPNWMRACFTPRGPTPSPSVHYYVQHNSCGRAPAYENHAGVQDPGGDWFEFPRPTEELYPGDVVHFYFDSGDSTTMPANMTPYDSRFLFASPGYPRSFTMRALPSVRDISAAQDCSEIEHPPVLWWDDGACREAAVWETAFANLGFLEGRDYDLFLTREPTARVLATNLNLGTGLGHHATPTSDLAAYSTLMYRSADLEYDTLTPSDAAVLSNWLTHGGQLGLYGDSIVRGLAAYQNPWTQLFLDLVLSVHYHDSDLYHMGVGSNAWVHDSVGWRCYVDGGCRRKPCGPVRHNYFDAVEAVGSAQRLMDFRPTMISISSPWPYAAMTQNLYGGGTVLYLPFGLIFDPEDTTNKLAPTSTRTEMLRWVLDYFGALPSGPPTVVDDTATPVFRVQPNYPNPFNPVTRIEFTLPRAEAVTLRIYDARGRLVKTLIDGMLERGDHAENWLGDDAAGRSVASGVYFYVLETETESRRHKMALVR